ncbi:MAG: flagellar biosynthetic protein FliR [Firmicutes bacterium]|jgi:flagellar biosynthetic protein FliR|nr:flagellar biosynthetic protein FliR [Bacillota bacterium]
MYLPGVTEREFLVFILVLVRMTGLFVIAPVFGNRSVPAQIKVGLAFAASVVAWPLAAEPVFAVPGSVWALASLVGSELLIGAVVGYVALLVFAAVQLAGQVVDMQMGFGLANIVDPSWGGQVTVLGQFKFLVATLLFLAANGHHSVVGGVVASYRAIPLGAASFGPEVFSLLVAEFSAVFSSAVRVALPVVAALIAAELALGVLSRSVPHMNVLMVGFPLKIVIGLGVMVLALPGMCDYLLVAFREMRGDIISALRAF